MRVCLDLDGVVVNWGGGVCKLLGIDPFEKETQAILNSTGYLTGGKFGTTEELEKKVLEAGYDFWMNLELLPWAYDVFNICNQYENLFFLTSHSNFPVASHAKIDYIKKHFNSEQVIITKHKYVCADDNTILVDDMNYNISEWVAHGGIPFHWKNQWELLSDPQKVTDELNRLEIFLSENFQLNRDHRHIVTA